MPGCRCWRAARLGAARRGMAGAGPGAAPWGRRGAALAVLGLALAALACLVLQGALLGAAALGAAGAWCAMRPGPPAPRPPAKAAANGAPAAPSGRFAKAAPRRPGSGLCSPPQAPRRRYPLPLSRSAVPGALPAACWDGVVRRSTAWARRAGPARSPVTVRIGRPGGPARGPVLEQLLSPVALLPGNSPDPCAKETVLNAIKESRKRAVEEEEEEEEQALGNDQDSKRRRHDSSGSGQSAFEPLVANGAPASLIPKPGSLKRGLASQCPDDCSNKRSRTSSMSSLNNTYTSGIPSSLRNAIASSYSSSRGLTQLWKRSGVSVSPLSSPASSRPQTPEWPIKKAREEETHCSNTSTPVKSDKELQTEKVVEMPVRRKRGSLSPPSASGSSGKRKRKIQLLSSRRGDQLALPPPPQLGYSITSEDLDAEKKAALQWFNKVLEDKPDSVPNTTAETTPVSRPLAFTVTTGTSSTPVSTAPVPASSNLLLDSLKKMQSSQAAPVPADSTGATIAFQPSSSASQLPAPAVSLESNSQPATSADTKPVPVLSTAALSISPASGTQPASSVAPPATTELGPTPSKPPSVLKPNILFGAPSAPPASQPAVTAAAAVPTTTPVFKPIFGALPKSESTAPGTTVISAVVTASVSSAPSSAPSTTTMFKPIFGSVTTASSPAKVSPFAFKPLSQPASAAEVPAASTTTLAGFTALPNVIFTTAATTATTLNSSTDATIKPVFSFGLNPPASTSTNLTVTTTASTSVSQPFVFGGLSSSATSTAPTFAAPVFQFGKPAPATVSATASVTGGPAFGQAPANSTAPTTTAGFSIFGSTTLTSSAPATAGQPALTFGSSTSAFGGTFSTSVKPLPPYSGAASQPAFSASAADSQLPTSKPAAGPVGFAPPFSFGAPTAQSTAQPVFGSSAPPTFGTSGTQVAFGTTTSVFSFGTATSTTASFGSGTQTTSSSTGTAVFGTAPSPFTFGAAAQPGPSAGAFGLSTPALSSGSPAVPFSFGAGQSGAAAAATPFGSSLTPGTLGAPSQSTPFAFTVPSTPDAKPVFGGTPAPTFGQSTPVPGAVGSGGGSLSFGTPSTPASAFPGVGTSFGPSTPAFSIGAGSKTGARQRLQARRQHTRKK
ncbi:nuclear envelope pore membrane protein POM 121 isoform X2 [Gallus gallus]|uniref:nuclear envelope pore membrane protein POM 121 isoform X2 n=1 Tax=Gallus gallus TaxID=9031 RepID=UPI001EFF9FE1|nr:nuclear envelope pore membrane protein POM 121 isoform X2 [Gallus gallus]